MVIKNPLKKRMLRIVSESDYEHGDTKKMGFVFGLIDADMGAQNVKIFDIINEGISRYYKNLLEHDIAFDDLINFLNRRISQTFPEQNIKDKCNALIGVIKGEKILFCANGSISCFLIYPHGAKKILPEDSERTLDVSNKLFSYSLNGDMQKNYAIYFCNQDFKETINPYLLEKPIKEAGAANVVQNIKDFLLKYEKDGQYGSFWIYYGSNENKTAGAPNSIMEIFKNEKKIEENLSPSIIASLNSAIKNKPFLTDALKYAGVFLKILFKALKKLLFFIGFLLFNSFFILTNARGKRREKQLIINDRFKGFGFKARNFYNSLTALSKALLISLLLLALALSAAIYYSVNLQKINQLKLSYKQTVERAENKYNEAESDMIFLQKNAAIKKLKSAMQDLETVPEKIHDGSYATLFNKVRDRLYKIQNISEAGAPVLIADFSAEPSQDIYPPIYLSNGKINLFSTDEALSADTKNQAVAKSQFKVAGLAGGIYYYYAPQSILYSIENGDSMQISHPGTLVSDLKKVVLGPNEEIKKFVVYNDIMYSLSPSEKYFSIWKHNPSLGGFGKPSLWATDNIPGGAPVSLAVDGSLYILFSDNQIYKYYQGRKADWKYDAEGAPDKAVYSIIFTNENYKNIYLAGKNIVSIISKDGEYLSNTLLPALSDIKDIAVDEAANTIYVLDGKKIYAFSYQL